jgi:hypothetical protein
MKTEWISLFLILTSTVAFAQHPLTGSWKLMSATVIGKEGTKRELNSGNTHELLIFSPTHIASISEMVDPEGKKTFNQSMLGMYQLSGNTYTVMPLMASWQINAKEKAAFSFTIAGDIYRDHGTVTNPDGTINTVERTYQRITLPPQETGSVVGTWAITGDESKEKGIQLITPTHMYYIGYKNDVFDYSIAGTFIRKGGKKEVAREWVSSDTINKKEKVMLKHRVVGGKLHVNGTLYSEDGTIKTTWSETMDRIPKEKD